MSDSIIDLRAVPEQAWDVLDGLKDARADAVLRDLVRHVPGDPRVVLAHAEMLLAHGDYARGWPGYEARKRHPRFARAYPRLPGREWLRGPLQGRRVLVRADAAPTATLLLARYIPLLAARGARVILVCPPAFVALFAQLPSAVASQALPLPEYDFWVDQMSLPRLFGTTPANIPTPLRYLQPDYAKAALWRQRFAATQDLRVGLALPGLDALAAAIAGIPGLRFHALEPAPHDMADLAALIDALDLVIGTDVPAVHLAAALGKPAWIVLGQAPHWCWMLNRADSPWYATARLFRQHNAGDWACVIREIAALLAAVAAGQAPLIHKDSAVPPAAAAPVTAAPHTRSTSVTATDQLRMVARFVRS